MWDAGFPAASPGPPEFHFGSCIQRLYKVLIKRLSGLPRRPLKWFCVDIRQVQS